MKYLLFLLLFPAKLFSQNADKKDISRWEKHAKKVTIIRDNFGIPHIYGKSDADAVFGLLYAQCEDDFKRVEMNYIEKLGRMSEVKGIASMYDDLLIRMVIDSSDAMNDYKNAEPWLKKLLEAFSDGVNYYLYKHPDVKPALLAHFEPWYPLLWTDGSIGAINTAGVEASDLKQFYEGRGLATAERKPAGNDETLTGSNGFAIAPKITESGNAMLYINPHVTFYFRPEVHMVSDEGLNVYGAVTWGQFFVYQGFNEHCGWMHTSSKVDAADLYYNKLTKNGNAWEYEYNGRKEVAQEKQIVIRFKTDSLQGEKKFDALYTIHGPVMSRWGKYFLSVRADNRLMSGLIQCWKRNKATSFKEFEKTLDLLGNISNNTVYADAEGNIAYWHGNRIPVRDTSYNWNLPVDGATKATEWKGYHKIEETVQLVNPPNGWLQNCNSTPFTVAGLNSPDRRSYPSYMAPDDENFRGINAVRVLDREKQYTLDKLINAGYDNYLSAFEILIPGLIKKFETSQASDFYSQIAEPINVLRNWDYRTSDTSVATTLAIEWAERIMPSIQSARPKGTDTSFVAKVKTFIATADANKMLTSLLTTQLLLKDKYGKWRVPWGEINRYQRISSDIDAKFRDDQPSTPVGFASAIWGMLPSYSSRYFSGTKKRYGYNGNSFVCAVEFGKRIRAKSLLAGGESGDAASPHFTDQLEMYANGKFKDVLFYKEDVEQHAEKTYHPGDN